MYHGGEKTNSYTLEATYGRAAVDDSTDRSAVALAVGGDTEKSTVSRHGGEGYKSCGNGGLYM